MKKFTKDLHFLILNCNEISHGGTDRNAGDVVGCIGTEGFGLRTAGSPIRRAGKGDPAGTEQVILLKFLLHPYQFEIITNICVLNLHHINTDG